MMTAFYREGDRIEQAFVRTVHELTGAPVWIDLNNPSFEEERRIKALLNIAIPNREEIWRNHITNHMYSENGIAYMNAAVIHKTDSQHPKTSAITFIAAPQCLVTIRYIYPTSFEHFQRRLTNHPQHYPTADHILEGLLEEMVARVAYHAELIDQGLDDLSYQIFDDHAFENKQGNPSLIMRRLVQKLGTLNTLNAKTHDSLNSLLRMQTFYREELGTEQPQLTRRLDVLLHETETLADQSNFLSSQINFQLDASLGLINVEQNLISKIFTVATVCFLPMTVISGIYGMNFEHMPELHWLFGYPFAIGLMFLAPAIVYYVLKQKGWL